LNAINLSLSVIIGHKKGKNKRIVFHVLYSF
jgi:hypothetical protein